MAHHHHHQRTDQAWDQGLDHGTDQLMIRATGHQVLDPSEERVLLDGIAVASHCSRMIAKQEFECCCCCHANLMTSDVAEILITAVDVLQSRICS
eukprot:CAMPEP_0194485012 /NCGR_PEP_ID=MMETSP0253-20130528/6152_1 /TAXON_ID=2966 /ORGANISM="Noctiluca scintillans" /LENGTH=94 /DNA_ID=CAMNT_0039324919 /DNA_START=20 /DNA_END=301 /DNA_ORIENTATION=+